MSASIRHTLLLAVARMLRPVVRSLLRHGVSCDEFIDVSKRMYVEEAEQSFAIPGRKTSTSRISILTGLNRKDVQRIRSLPALSEEAPEGHNRAEKVVGGWLTDPAFTEGEGVPRTLSLEGNDGFAGLVKRYSGDMPTRAMLDELERVGAVRIVDGELVKLVTSAYVPHHSEQGKLELFGLAMEDLVGTLDHNLVTEGDASHMQLTLAYNNLPEEALAPFKESSQKEMFALLSKLNQDLSKQDRDVNPNVKGEGRYRAGIGVYYFERPYEVEENEESN